VTGDEPIYLRCTRGLILMKYRPAGRYSTHPSSVAILHIAKSTLHPLKVRPLLQNATLEAKFMNFAKKKVNDHSVIFVAVRTFSIPQHQIPPDMYPCSAFVMCDVTMLGPMRAWIFEIPLSTGQGVFREVATIECNNYNTTIQLAKSTLLLRETDNDGLQLNLKSKRHRKHDFGNGSSHFNSWRFEGKSLSICHSIAIESYYLLNERVALVWSGRSINAWDLSHMEDSENDTEYKPFCHSIADFESMPGRNEIVGIGASFIIMRTHLMLSLLRPT